MKSFIRLGICIPLAYVLIISCSCIDVRYPTKGKPVVLRENTSLVFGRIQVIEDNVDVTSDFCDPMNISSSADRLLNFTLLDLETRKVVLTVIAESDGSFYWILPNGYFRITNIGYRTDVDPYLAFSVNGSNRYIYIGNIVLKSESNIVPHLSLRKHKATLKTEISDINITVEDNFIDEANGLKARFPNVAERVMKELMIANYDR